MEISVVDEAFAASNWPAGQAPVPASPSRDFVILDDLGRSRSFSDNDRTSSDFLMIASDGCPRLSRENSREDREWAEAAASRLSGVAAVEAECAGEALGSGGSGGGGVDEIMGKTEAEVATLVKRLSNASMPASSAGADSSPQPGSATAPPPARRPAPLEQPAAPLDGDATSKRKAPATPSTPAGVDAFFGDLLNSPKGDLSKSSSKILDNWAL